jgi:hypothetical protein
MKTTERNLLYINGIELTNAQKKNLMGGAEVNPYGIYECVCKDANQDPIYPYIQYVYTSGPWAPVTRCQEVYTNAGPYANCSLED